MKLGQLGCHLENGRLNITLHVTTKTKNSRGNVDLKNKTIKVL